MTLPRQILPGRIYLITRRCSQRQFLLRPDDTTRQVFLYCLAVAAQRHGIEVIGWIAMSNHHHLVVRDCRGELPAFLAMFHRLVAKVLNVRWGRWENLWSSEQTCVTHLVEHADIVDKVVYALVNPVLGHLVERAADWPGTTSLHHLDGQPIVIERPKLFFRAEGCMPERITLTLSRPAVDSGGDMDAAAWRTHIRDIVAARERAAADDRRIRGMRVLGRKVVRRASPFDRPVTREPRRTLRPTVACLRSSARVRELRALRAFRLAYAVARRALQSGRRDALFPPGSYRHRALAAAASQVTAG